MKVTGIVRRFDDLGRIVIPKEIRKLLFGTPEKSEGMPMEIFMNKDEIIIRKYEENKADDVCEWNGEQSRLVTFTRFTTTCGDNIDLQTNSELLKAFRYCPFCGRKLKIVGD